MIYKAILLLMLSYMINGKCKCNQFSTMSDCFPEKYCFFVDGVCSEQLCENLPFEGKCESPRCIWKNEQCETFNASQDTCQQLSPQNCNNYNGCSYDYETYKCNLINTCTELKVEQCNGQTLNGNICKVDPFQSKCIEMIDCSSLTGEISCLSEYPQCSYKNGICVSLTCGDITDSLSCSLIDECQWRESLCQKKDCSLIYFGYQCTSNKCGWADNKCFECIQEYAQMIGIVVFLLLI